MTHVGFTGTQHGMSDAQLDAVASLLYRLRDFNNWFHHGDCVGADAQAVDIALGESYQIHRHPPVNGGKQARTYYHTTEPELPYLERNHRIVDLTTVLIAAPRGRLEERRSGTWATVRYARKLHRPIYIVLPQGDTRKENVV